MPNNDRTSDAFFGSAALWKSATSVGLGETPSPEKISSKNSVFFFQNSHFSKLAFSPAAWSLCCATGKTALTTTDVDGARYTLYDILNLMLKHFCCCTDSERKSFISVQAYECWERSYVTTRRVKYQLMIPWPKVYYTEHGRAIKRCDELILGGRHMPRLENGLVRFPRVHTEPYLVRFLWLGCRHNSRYPLCQAELSRLRPLLPVSRSPSPPSPIDGMALDYAA